MVDNGVALYAAIVAPDRAHRIKGAAAAQNHRDTPSGVERQPARRT